MIQPVAGKGQPWNAYCVSGMDGSSNMGCGIVLYGNFNESKVSLRARWNQRAGNGEMSDSPGSGASPILETL